ncbi:hypothetical protein AB28_4151 [Raoultella ornithinolytica 2-156-04_S1_C2]|nr:hypothetical protein AB00_4154 [Raoultella ornithinolytica 2-156-04_S1_C1]KDX11542.1 hypothetical protein AB28_4151 [Raoultella ornithinolytica 2-156-04_S1_C2]
MLNIGAIDFPHIYQAFLIRRYNQSFQAMATATEFYLPENSLPAG